MRRLPYALAGLALLPMCFATGRTLLTLIAALRVSSLGEASLGVWWLLGGFLIWIALFFLMPRPVKTYVLGHELTHAFWGLLMGARVSKLRVGNSGGSVQLSKTNFLITLAPYFFPFYTMLLLALRAVLGLFYDFAHYEPLWLGLVGLSWAFHVTFTITTLMQEQPDIAAHGRIFSYVIIVWLNLLGICIWLVAAGSPTWRLFSTTLVRDAVAAYALCGDAVARLWLWVRK